MKNSMLTLRRSIVLAVLIGLLAPAIVVNGYGWLHTYNSEIDKQTAETAGQNSAALAAAIAEPLSTSNRGAIETMVEDAMQRNDDLVRVEVRDGKDAVLVSSERRERRQNFIADSSTFVHFLGQSVGKISVEASSTRLQKVALGNLHYQLLALAAQIGLSILLLLILFEKRFMRPLRDLGAQVGQLAAQRLGTPFAWARSDEIGLFAQQLETSRTTLRALLDELERNSVILAKDAPGKKRKAETHSLSDARFAGAFHSNPDSVSIVRLSDNALVEANASFEKITGFTRAEWSGKSTLQLGIWALPEQRKAFFRVLDDAKSVRDFSWSLRNKAGETRNCLINAMIFSVNGDDYALGVIRDVTSQRLLEEQKAEADHALLRLAQGTHGSTGASFFSLLVSDLAAALRTDCAFIALRDPHDVQRMRALASHLHGNPVNDFAYPIPGSPCERTLAGDSGEACIFASDVRALFPHDAVLADYAWDSYAGAPLHDVHGKVIGVLAVMHSKPLRNPDLVRSLLQVFSERASAELERKRAEEELRLSEQRFATIFHSTPVPMFVTQISNDNVIKDINSAFERLFVRSRHDVIGKSTLELDMYCNPQDRGTLLHELKTTGNIENHMEVWMLRGDKTKVLIHLSGHVFLLEGEQFGIIACQDVTEKRLIEQEIRELNSTLEDRVTERTEELQQANQELETTLDALNQAQEELINSEKLAALGALVAGISHELNTPVGNSLMVASTLSDQTATVTGDYRQHKGIKRSSLENYLADVGKAGDILMRNLHRAADLVNSFKQVAIDQISSQRRTFSLAEVINEILMTLWPVIRKSAVMIEQSIPNELNFDSYPGPLGQVLTNLINNALLHGFEDRAQGTVEIIARKNSTGWVELIIKDDGVGIPAASLSRIFDPFFTTKLGAGGSGLGLNITHNIVTGVLGGRVRVQSAVGIGTTFILTLPLIAPQRMNDDEALHPQS